MKKYIVMGLLCAGVIFGLKWLDNARRTYFHVSGVINLEPRLARYAARPNTICFVIVKNSGDVPVAIKRYVNPSFPLRFALNSEDLVFSEPGHDNMTIEAQINTHGKVGQLMPGDMFGNASAPVSTFASNVKISVAKRLDLPSLASAGYSDKGQFMFTLSAR